MNYKNTVTGIFLERPNRFIAYVDIGGEKKVCHVKNTGRCKELLIQGAKVILEKSDNKNRKTEFDLIAVYKGENLINIDSQAPNVILGEWLESTNYFGNTSYVKSEERFGNSRFDFYIIADGKKIFIEVKGATLEEKGIVLFPDAPTERGVKHINELIEAKKQGYEAYVIFIIQMENCKHFSPNRKMHETFADALKKASAEGVNIIALNSKVGEDFLHIKDFVRVVLV